MRETSQEKIQKICDVLRRETLEPAKEESRRIIAEAEAQAVQIVHQAEQQAEKLHASAKQAIEQERNIFHSSLAQAAKQAVEALRQEIEQKLFNQELTNLVAEQSAKPEIVAQLVNSVVAAIDQRGISTDLSVDIPANVSKEQVIKALSQAVIKKLRNEGIVIGSFAGGIKVHMHDKNITVDLSDSALKELLAHYVRKDFRELLFRRQ